MDKEERMKEEKTEELMGEGQRKGGEENKNNLKGSWPKYRQSSKTKE